MFLFGKNKKEEQTPAAKPVSPVPAAPAPKAVNPDDFFKDIDRKPKQAAAPKPVVQEEIRPDIEAPVVEGLREAPLPAPVSTISDVSTNDIDTDILPDKTLIPPPVPFEFEEPSPAEKSIRSDGDDFFADLDRKAAKIKNNNKAVIEPPTTESLRDAPPPPPVSTLSGVSTDTVETDTLPVKPPVENYQGNMNDADVDEEEAMLLEFKHAKQQREDDGSLDYDNETYGGIDIKNSAPVTVEEIKE